MNRPRMREQARTIAERARRRMAEHESGRVNDTICALADAIEMLADAMESLESVAEVRR